METPMNQPQTTPAPQTPQAAPTPTPSPMPPTPSPEPKRSILGPIIAIIIVLIVLGLGGLYLWGSMLTKEKVSSDVPAQETNTEQMPAPVVRIDTVENIEADLSATDMNSFDADLQALDQEFEGTAVDQ